MDPKLGGLGSEREQCYATQSKDYGGHCTGKGQVTTKQAIAYVPDPIHHWVLPFLLTIVRRNPFLTQFETSSRPIFRPDGLCLNTVRAVSNRRPKTKKAPGAGTDSHGPCLSHCFPVMSHASWLYPTSADIADSTSGLCFRKETRLSHKWMPDSLSDVDHPSFGGYPVHSASSCDIHYPGTAEGHLLTEKCPTRSPSFSFVFCFGSFINRVWFCGLILCHVSAMAFELASEVYICGSQSPAPCLDGYQSIFDPVW
jgi:hypothetical protein